MRHVSWFSCGAASAVATKLAIAQHPGTIVVRCIVENEDPDNDRFANDCAEWFNRPVLELRSAKYKDCWQVWEERRFLNGPAGALCTVEMKKKVRQRFQQPGDLQGLYGAGHQRPQDVRDVVPDGRAAVVGEAGIDRDRDPRVPAGRV